MVIGVADSFRYSEKVSVSAEDKSRYLAFAQRTVKAAGASTLAYFRAQVEVQNKLSNGQFDPVTQADKSAEKIIRQAIERAYPNHGVYGEEYGFSQGNGLTWVIDPIDGTRAFMSGMLHWGVLLALFDGDQPIIGVMYQPYTDELFCGDGEQAFLLRGEDRRTLVTSSCTELSRAVLATTGYDWFTQSSRSQFDRLKRQVELCRVGGDCYLYAMVAMGTVHLGTDVALEAYDIQALIPIIRGAGGVVTTYDGNNPSLGGNILASSNASLHARALEALNGGSNIC